MPTHRIWALNFIFWFSLILWRNARHAHITPYPEKTKRDTALYSILEIDSCITTQMKLKRYYKIL